MNQAPELNNGHQQEPGGFQWRAVNPQEAVAKIGRPDSYASTLGFGDKPGNFDAMFHALTWAIQVQRQSLMDFLYDLREETHGETDVKELIEDMFEASLDEISHPCNNRLGIIRALKSELAGYITYIEKNAPRGDAEPEIREQVSALAIYPTEEERLEAAHARADILIAEVQAHENIIERAKSLGCWRDYTALHDLFTVAIAEGRPVDRHQVSALAGFFMKRFIALCEGESAGQRISHVEAVLSRIPQKSSSDQMKYIRAIQAGGRRRSSPGADEIEEV